MSKLESIIATGNRALARLAKIYPSVYQALLDEERARLREGSS